MTDQDAGDITSIIFGPAGENTFHANHDEKLGLIYSAHVRLAQTSIAVENKRVKLSLGMVASVEIKTGHRRVLEYFLSQLMEYQGERFKER